MRFENPVFVVPDMHGHYDTLHSLLVEAGVLLPSVSDHVDGYERHKDITVVQLGDLANCVATDLDGDMQCLSTVGEWIDYMLVGNHEHPYFDGPMFSGFWRYPEVEKKLLELDEHGLIGAAVLVDDILISHAGIVRGKFLPFLDEFQTAEEAHDFAEGAWREDKKHALFSMISHARGGWSRQGGILWSDWSEGKNKNFNQIVGHTPQPDGPQRREYSSTGKWSLCIDCGAKYGRGATGVMIKDGDVQFVSTPMLSGNHW